MSTGDKRSVSTDALETLGTILGDGVGRDAIHLAVEPVIAAEWLYPGQDVGLLGEGKAGRNGNPVGIVDPFLKSKVEPGEKFWLVVYPRQITSLRHVWTHPAFEPNVVSVPAVNSEEWLREFCASADCPGYDSVMRLIREAQLGDPEDYGNSYVDDESLHFSGLDAHGEIPEEFWRHVEIVLGPQSVKPKYFSCSC